MLFKFLQTLSILQHKTVINFYKFKWKWQDIKFVGLISCNITNLRYIFQVEITLVNQYLRGGETGKNHQDRCSHSASLSANELQRKCVDWNTSKKARTGNACKLKTTHLHYSGFTQYSIYLELHKQNALVLNNKNKMILFQQFLVYINTNLCHKIKYTIQLNIFYTIHFCKIYMTTESFFTVYKALSTKLSH